MRLDDAFGIETEAVAAPAVLRHLTMYKIGRDVEVIDRSDELDGRLGDRARRGSTLALGGPLAPEHAHREQAVGGSARRAIATDLGVDLTVARDEAQTLVTALCRRRAPSRSASRPPRSSGSSRGDRGSGAR